MRARPLTLLLALLSFASPALAFTHIVGPGDTLASVAEKYYGKIQYERLLVAANLLDSRGGTPIVRGMRLEVPSLAYRKVETGETWETISAELLGAPSRAEVLSVVNGSSPWLTPEEGAEIVIPYNLRVIVGENEQLTSIALRHLGDMNKAWVLDRYNGLKGKRPEAGDVLLVPLSDLPLTDAGRKAALAAAGGTCAEAGGDARRAQQRVSQEMPALVADVRAGRYVEAVARGTRFLATDALSEAQLALVHQKLTEAYVALDAPGLATQSCSEWRKRDAGTELDPTLVSPKVLAACERGGK